MFEKVVLPNGLRVVLAPMRDVKSISCTVFVGAGSRYEQRDINGISHFLEHMFFKGTKKRPSALAISEEVDGIGGEFNAGTSKEYTIYYIKARSKHLALTLDVLSDMLLNATFVESELEREKGVILEELKMYEDMPMRDIGEIYEQTLWGDQPLGWKTVGTKKAITATTRAKMVAYKNSLYTLDNMIVGLAGDFDPKKALKQIELYFSGFPAKRQIQFLPVREHQTEPVFHFHPKKTEQAHLSIGTRGFSRYDRDRYTGRVMNIILGANMSSRLFIAVRERQGLCYYVHSDISNYYDTGEFDVQAGVDLDRINQALEAILVELRRMKDELVTEKELQKAKEYIKGRFVLSLEDTSGMIEYLGMQELLEGKIQSVDEIFERFDAVTRRDIRRFAQRLFDTARLNLALIAPRRVVDEDAVRKLLVL